jgi:hypothetical protein
MPPVDNEELKAKFKAVIVKIKHDLNEFLDLLVKEEKDEENK